MGDVTGIVYGTCDSCMAAPAAPPALALQGVLDFTVPSGGSDGKAIHVVATDNIADLKCLRYWSCKQWRWNRRTRVFYLMLFQLAQEMIF